MDVLQQHSLCDAILGLASQASDIVETVGAVLQLVESVGKHLDPDTQRHAANYAVALANASARAEALQKSLVHVASLRKTLEEGSARVQRMLRERELVDQLRAERDIGEE